MSPSCFGLPGLIVDRYDDLCVATETTAGMEARRAEWLAPGHGFLMAEPRRAFEAILAHRLRREAKVLAALRDAAGPASAETLLARVYDDVPARLQAMAMRSLQAHLIKLRDEGLASDALTGQWTLVGS